MRLLNPGRVLCRVDSILFRFPRRRRSVFDSRMKTTPLTRERAIPRSCSGKCPQGQDGVLRRINYLRIRHCVAAPTPPARLHGGRRPCDRGRERPSARAAQPGAMPSMASGGSPPSLPSAAAPASSLAARRPCRPPGRTSLAVSARRPARGAAGGGHPPAGRERPGARRHRPAPFTPVRLRIRPRPRFDDSSVREALCAAARWRTAPRSPPAAGEPTPTCARRRA